MTMGWDVPLARRVDGRLRSRPSSDWPSWTGGLGLSGRRIEEIAQGREGPLAETHQPTQHHTDNVLGFGD